MLPAAEAAEVAEVVLPIIIQAAAGDKADGRVRFRRFCLREPCDSGKCGPLHTCTGQKETGSSREKLKEFSIGEDHWDRSEIQERVRESYYRIQECWRDRDLEKGYPYLSQKMQQEFQTKFEWSRMRHEVFVMEGIQLLDAILVEAENEDGDDRDYIWYLIHGKMIDYVYHEETGELLKGSRKMEDFFEYWRFVLEDGNWVLDEICQKEEVDNGRKLC